MIFLFTLLAAIAAVPTLKMHKACSSHMVLQAEQPSLFGFAKPGASVSVTLGSETKKCAAAGDGKWLVTLDPRPASPLKGPGETISVTDGTDSIVLEDVLFGDVWVCSGQSNSKFE